MYKRTDDVMKCMMADTQAGKYSWNASSKNDDVKPESGVSRLGKEMKKGPKYSWNVTSSNGEQDAALKVTAECGTGHEQMQRLQVKNDYVQSDAVQTCGSREAEELRRAGDFLWEKYNKDKLQLHCTIL